METISAEALSELCGKLFVLNTDLLDSLLGVYYGKYQQFPVIIAFLALLVFNIRFWDRFKFPEKFVQPPYHIILPCIEAVGHWVMSNIVMTIIINIYRIVFNIFVVTRIERVTSWSELIARYLRGLPKDKSVEHLYYPYFPFFITLVASVGLLISATSAHKRGLLLNRNIEHF